MSAGHHYPAAERSVQPELMQPAPRDTLGRPVEEGGCQAVNYAKRDQIPALASVKTTWAEGALSLGALKACFLHPPDVAYKGGRGGSDSISLFLDSRCTHSHLPLCLPPNETGSNDRTQKPSTSKDTHQLRWTSEEGLPRNSVQEESVSRDLALRPMRVPGLVSPTALNIWR